MTEVESILSFLMLVVYTIMLVVYTIILVEKLNILRGIIAIVVTIGVALYIFKFVFPISENLNIIYSIIINIFAVVLGLIITFIKAKYFSPSKNPFPEDKKDPEDKEFQEEFVDLALKKTRYSNLENKILGLKHLYHLATNIKYKESIRDKAYYGLCDLLKDEKDKLLRNIIVYYICKTHKQRNDGTKQELLDTWDQ